jgi:hypothetical protein
LWSILLNSLLKTIKGIKCGLKNEISEIKQTKIRV